MIHVIACQDQSLLNLPHRMLPHSVEPLHAMVPMITTDEVPMARQTGERFNKVNELLNLRALRNFNIIWKSMYGQDILCGISKGTFEIPHHISYPYTERYRFYSQVKI